MVEGEDSSPDYDPEDEREPLPPKSTPRRPTRANNRSPEPEFVMPPLDNDTLEASWAESSGRSPKPRKAYRSMETDARRRTMRQVNNGSPESRSPVKTDMERTKSAKSKSRSLHSHPPEGSGLQNILEVVVDHSTSMLSWILEVVGGSLRVLKTPISYILAVWLLFGLGVILRNLVTTSIYASLSPVCRIPGMSVLNLPFCPAYRVDTRHGDPPPVEFEQLMMVQSKFEEVLQDTAGNVALPMDMKRGEASIRDLRQIVRYSQLKSK